MFLIVSFNNCFSALLMIPSPFWVLVKFFNIKLTWLTPWLKHLSKNLRWFLKLLTLPSIFFQFLNIPIEFFPYFCSNTCIRFLILLLNQFGRFSLKRNMKFSSKLTSFCSQTWLLLLVCLGKCFSLEYPKKCCSI